jgi:hypothetical protein
MGSLPTQANLEEPMASILGRIVFVLMTVMTGTVAVRAAPFISLSSPSDLTHLTVGDQIRVDVTLGGVSSFSEYLFVLNTRETFPSSLFQVIADPGNGSGLSPGPVLAVASQRDTFNALSSITVGAVTGNFSSMPTPSQAITRNGLFYSFALRAIAPGNGAILFDPGGSLYASNMSGFNLAFLGSTGPLSFSVTAIPEPTSAVMIGFGTLALVSWVRRRRAAEGRTIA